MPREEAVNGRCKARTERADAEAYVDRSERKNSDYAEPKPSWAMARACSYPMQGVREAERRQEAGQAKGHRQEERQGESCHSQQGSGAAGPAIAPKAEGQNARHCQNTQETHRRVGGELEGARSIHSQQCDYWIQMSTRHVPTECDPVEKKSDVNHSDGDWEAPEDHSEGERPSLLRGPYRHSGASAPVEHRIKRRAGNEGRLLVRFN